MKRDQWVTRDAQRKVLVTGVFRFSMPATARVRNDKTRQSASQGTSRPRGKQFSHLVSYHSCQHGARFAVVPKSALYGQEVVRRLSNTVKHAETLPVIKNFTAGLDR